MRVTGAMNPLDVAAPEPPPVEKENRGPQVTPKTVIGLLVAFAALFGVCLLPLPEGLSHAGLNMLAVLVFAVILWLSEVVNYEVAAVLISVALTFLVGLASVGLHGTGQIFGTTKALNLAMSGFSNNGFIMVAVAMFIAAAMALTGLDKRLAYTILAKVGASSRRIMVGIIIVVSLLSFMIPSGTARTACMVPVVLGLIAAFGTGQRSNLAAGLMLLVPFVTQLWNIAVLTATAQNLLIVGYMDTLMHQRVTWADWFIAGLPWSVAMSVVLYFVVTIILPPEIDELPGGKEVIAKVLKDMGPMTGPEKRLLLVSIVLLIFWMTERRLHDFDTTTTALAGLALLLAPGYGVMTWKELQQITPWGTIVVFGASLGLGSALLATGAGQWLATWLVAATGLSSYGAFGIFVIFGAFLVIVHIGFASVTSMAAAFTPIIIAVLATTSGVNQLGMTMLLGYVISLGFILPINGAPNMVALATGAFTTRQFVTVGVTITVIGFLLMVLMARFYWPLLGLM